MKRYLFVGAIILMSISSGCAFVDDKVSLGYNQGALGAGSKNCGDIQVERPIAPEMKTKKNGQYVVGNVKNSYGMKTADAVTSDSIPGWVANALSIELKAAGFAPTVVDDIGTFTGPAVKTRIMKVWVEPDMGFWTLGAVGEVQLRMALYKDGRRIKEFDIESKGQPKRSAIELSWAAKKREALRIALEECMKKAIPIIVETYGAKVTILEQEDTQATNHNIQENKAESPIFQRSAIWIPDTRRSLWVLAVGVGQYKDQQVPALPYARSDAEKVRDWFLKLDVNGVTRDNVHILCDEQATRENFLSQIDWLRRQALPEDAVFVYFAGHGAPELNADGTSVDAKYLVLYDTNPSQLFATGFPIDDLTRKLDTVKAKTQVIILEACYAGPVGQQILRKTPTADLEIRPRLIKQLGEKGGRVILSASSGRQMAIGSEEIKGGLFTHYLLNAWADGSQRLLSDRFDEATYHVRRASNQLGSLQEPVRFGDQNVDVILKVK